MQKRGKTWGPYKQNASASVYFPKLVSLVLALLYCLLETHNILSPPRKKFLKSIALTPPQSSRSSLPACWVFHECHQHLKSNTLRHKTWLSPSLASSLCSCHLLITHIPNRWQRCRFPVLPACGDVPRVALQCAVAFCSGRKPRSDYPLHRE